jgi:hypothetical protein
MLSTEAVRQVVPRLRLSPRIRLPRLTVDRVLFVAVATLYLVVGAILALGLHSIAGDAWSRVANAYYVLYSRDPHLAAIGFIWSPLPSLVTLPFLPLKALWPSLVQEGFITNILSALLMAAAALQLYRMGLELGVSRGLSIATVAVFALHPYVIQYGANGMSEAMFVFFLVATTRQLSRWIVSGAATPLVLAALWLGGAYLVRYEAAPVAAASALVVMYVTYRRTAGTTNHRRLAALTDAMVYVAPFTAAFLSWALASWLIIGSPFAQFSSAYGITSQLEADAQIFSGTGQGTPLAVLYTVQQMLSLEPLLFPIVVIGIATAAMRRDPRVLAPLAIYGAVIAFTVWAWLTGRTGGWLRYYIVLIPFAVSMILVALANLRDRTDATQLLGHRGPRARRLAGRTASGAVALALLVMGVLALPAGAATVSGSAGRQPEGRIQDLYMYQVAGDVADDLDRLHLPRGTVLADAFMAFAVVVQSDNPLQFVITPDRDFEDVLADPAAYGIRYLLVPPPDLGWGELDALNREWPSLYEDGDEVGRLVREFETNSDRYRWRLYELVATAEGQ